ATQTWISAGTVITTDRTIKNISGSQITLDAPLTDSFDTNYLGTPAGTMSHYTWSGRISQAGLEHLRIEAPPVASGYSSISMDNVIDSWVRDVAIQDGANCVSLSKDCKRMTVDNVVITHTVVQTASAAPSDFATTGTQILLNQCHSYGTGSWPYVMHTTGTGPIVLLNCSSTQDRGVAPHQRWCTGILADNCQFPNAQSKDDKEGIAYGNHGTDGSGHGWTTGWSVGWNVTSPYLLADAAPGTENWCIGGVGAMGSSSDPHGIYESLGSHVSLGETGSLYLEQLRERLGYQALVNIGYGSYISADPPSREVNVGGANTTYAVTVSTNTGFSGVVSLGVSGLPPDATANFNPLALTNAGISTLTVTTAPTTPPGNYNLTVTATNGGQGIAASISLVVVRPPSDLRWLGTFDDVWDSGGTSNWFNLNPGVADRFYDGDNVLLDDTPGVKTNVVIATGATVEPAAMTNNSSLNNFTISGAGAIGGSTRLAKLGTSRLTLNTANSFAGDVIIGGGTLTVGNAGALGNTDGTTVVTNGGTLDVNGFNLTGEEVTVSGPGAGNGGAIVNNGSAQTSALRVLTLAGNATFGGTGRWDVRNSGGAASLNTVPANSPFNI
ncbi:MAG TPA: hypothetical protein VFF11_10170, partial [Candidatus Binatia bacterium]|nr:hypothetical protein [Candidatus Binatia bacterium]